jgi:gluconolactonase
MDRRAFLATTAATATAVTMKAASAATVAAFGETGVPARATEPLGPLPNSVYPDSHLESMVKPKEPTFGPAGFPAFAGTMAVERIATGFRWAEGPVYFPAGRYVLFSDLPNNRIMRLDLGSRSLGTFGSVDTA